MENDETKSPNASPPSPSTDPPIAKEEWQKALVAVRRFGLDIATNPVRRVRAIVLTVTILFLGATGFLIQERYEATKKDPMECLFKGKFTFRKPVLGSEQNAILKKLHDLFSRKYSRYKVSTSQSRFGKKGERIYFNYHGRCGRSFYFQGKIVRDFKKMVPNLGSAGWQPKTIVR